LIGLIHRPVGRVCLSADASLFISFSQIAIDCKDYLQNASALVLRQMQTVAISASWRAGSGK
jgi:hypothetical protein